MSKSKFRAKSCVIYRINTKEKGGLHIKNCFCCKRSVKHKWQKSNSLRVFKSLDWQKRMAGLNGNYGVLAKRNPMAIPPLVGKFLLRPEERVADSRLRKDPPRNTRANSTAGPFGSVTDSVG